MKIIGIVIAATIIIPINKPIQSPMKHFFEQKFDRLLNEIIFHISNQSFN